MENNNRNNIMGTNYDDMNWTGLTQGSAEQDCYNGDDSFIIQRINN
jgi:hypothetical protein